MIYATDTDVVVIGIAVSSVFPNCKIWVAFGHGKKLRHVPCHVHSSNLGQDKSWGLLFFHALSGCDTVSSFYCIGKKTAWKVLEAIPELWVTFAQLSNAPSTVSEEQLKQIERFVVLLYQKSCSLTSVNEARKHMFSHSRKIENSPPTCSALVQHVRRAAYQAGHIWGQSLTADPLLPPPEEWDWEKKPGCSGDVIASSPLSPLVGRICNNIQ